MGHLIKTDDRRWMGAALALAERGRGRTSPNPNVGCAIVKDGRVVGRGWTQAGGRPHAEAMALTAAGRESRGATLYVTLEPCAHQSLRGPACAGLIAQAGVARVVAATEDLDPRTSGRGLDRLRSAGIEVTGGVREADALESMAGFITRRRFGRPHVTLKLGLSLDGRIALMDGRSRWITSPASRAHAHLERSRHETILVGWRTWAADKPGLTVRLEGLEERSPVRVIFSRQSRFVQTEVVWVTDLDQISDLPGDHVLVEGGADTAAAFLRADLVDRLLLYRAPILIGAGKAAVGDMGLGDLGEAHGRWRLVDGRQLGSDRLEAYLRQR